jgi:hypothetical protein
MSSMKFARGPLYGALVIGVVGVAILLIPRLGFSLPFEGDLVGAGLGLLAVLFLVVSLVMGSRSGDDEDYDAITEEDLIPSVAFGPSGSYADQQTPLTSAEKKALKQAEKAAKKEETARVKFEKQARREADKAARKARKGRTAVDDPSDWIAEIRQSVSPMDDPTPLDQTTAFGTPNQQPVFQPQPVAPQQPVFQPQPVAPSQPVAPPQPVAPSQPVAAAAAMFAAQPAGVDNFGTVANEVNMEDAASATDAPMYEGVEEAPSWVADAYNDPNFAVPFADADEVAPEDPTVEETAGAETGETQAIHDAIEEGALVEEPVEEMAVAAEFDSPAEGLDIPQDEAEKTVEVNDAVGEVNIEVGGSPKSEILALSDDVDTSLEPEPEDEEITEVEERLDRLAQDVLAIIDTARGEVRSIRRESEAARRRHNDKVSTLANALDDSRDEMTRLADELAEASQHRRAALDAQATLAQAQVEAQKAELERQEAVARLRQVRVAVLRREPVDVDLLAVVEKSLNDLIGDSPAE